MARPRPVYLAVLGSILVAFIAFQGIDPSAETMRMYTDSMARAIEMCDVGLERQAHQAGIDVRNSKTWWWFFGMDKKQDTIVQARTAKYKKLQILLRKNEAAVWAAKIEARFPLGVWSRPAVALLRDKFWQSLDDTVKSQLGMEEFLDFMFYDFLTNMSESGILGILCGIILSPILVVVGLIVYVVLNTAWSVIFFVYLWIKSVCSVAVAFSAAQGGSGTLFCLVYGVVGLLFMGSLCFGCILLAAAVFAVLQRVSAVSASRHLGRRS